MISQCEAVILSACRTPTGKFGGAFREYSAVQLGAAAIREIIRRADIPPEAVEEVILGNVVSAGLGQAPARQAAIHAGLPSSVNAVTINKVCGSGLKAVALAAQGIQAGDLEIAVAGGMESMSNAPYLAKQTRWGVRLGDAQLLDSLLVDGLRWPLENMHMGETAELVAEHYEISREAQDEFAVRSHEKAVRATHEGKFREEIVPVSPLDKDETPRENTNVEALRKLKPVFRKNGTITAGNAPGLNDAASALVVVSRKKAEQMGKKPMARILGYQSAGVEPKWVMMAPVPAIHQLLQKLQMSLDDFDLIELNEAFSVQALAVIRELKMNPEKVNVHGGAVALGHPLGASGARILTTLIHALKTYRKRFGLAALCLGGGNAIAMAIENL